jgi:CBS domain-containing protein
METGIKVGEVMCSEVFCVTVPGSRDDVLETLKEKHVSGVPALKEGKLVGMVTRVDLLKKPDEDQIALLMTKNPVTVEPDADVSDVAKLILSRDIRRLPVVEDDLLIGIVTTADIVRVIADLSITDPIGNYVEEGVVMVWEETPLPLVGGILELAHTGAAPILNRSEKLVGIVTDRDLISAAVIEDSVELADMSSALDEDRWTWESIRETMVIYYGVSKIMLPDVPVKDVMVKDPVTVFKVSETSECARLMSKNKFDQIPVVTPNQKLVGLLRDKDTLKAIADD